MRIYWVLALFLLVAVAQSSAKPAENIVILNTLNPEHYWTRGQIAGIRDILDNSGKSYSIAVENLDYRSVKKPQLAGYLKQLRDIFALKYEDRGEEVAAVFLTDDTALDFGLQYGHELFPNADFVFSGINADALGDRLAQAKNPIYGVLEKVDLFDTIETALKLHPDTRQIVVVGDLRYSSIATQERIQALEPQFAVPFTYLNDFTWDAFPAKVRAIEPDSIILRTGFYNDRQGVKKNLGDTMQLLSGNARAPIYSFWKGVIGMGIVGGKLLSGHDQGREAAQLFLADTTTRFAGPAKNHFVFDFGQLERFGISKGALPPGSLILNEPETFYYRYYRYIWAILSFIALQTVIIILLSYLINRARRREREILSQANMELEGRVTERTHELQLRTLELERFNEELSQFTYVASHDLQEPVRNLISYSTLLQEDLAAGQMDDVAEDVGYITSAALRMQRLVRDLLALSRAGHSELRPVQVALDECVDAALEALVECLAQTQATLTRVPLPRVMGDPVLLTQAYQNLIHNAIKFAGDKAPVIELSAVRDGDTWRLGVRDNGIGIDPEFADQIFKPFKRLHGMGEYEGTGIGLSICHKAIERLGGEISVESELGQGALFQFTLPQIA